MKKGLFAALAVVLATGCGDTTITTPEANVQGPPANTPLFDHVVGEPYSGGPSVGVTVSATPTNNVRITWHTPSTPLVLWSVRVCPQPSGTCVYEADVPGTRDPAYSNPHRYVDLTLPPGTYRASVKVTISNSVENEWRSNQNSSNFTIAPNANRSPTAGFVWSPVAPNEGQAIVFNATASDPDNDALTYAWNFGDGNTSSLEDPSHTYADNGTYTVSLIVSDGKGGTAEVSIGVTAANVAPTADFSNTGPVNEGSSFTLALSNANDVSSVDAAAGFSYAFDCGDGAGLQASTESTRSCATSNNGQRSVVGRVIDKDGGFSEYTASVTVNNVAPTADFSNNGPVNEGSNFTLALTNASDPSSDDVAAGFTYAFDCGDGNGLSAASASSSKSCATTDNGVRSVFGRIFDQDGGFTEYSGSVTINNVAPTITSLLVSTDPIMVGSSAGVTIFFTDPGSADTHSATVEWGVAACELSGSESYNASALVTNGATVTRTFTEAGVYSVCVKVTDDDGGSDAQRATGFVVVADPSAGFVTGGGWINSPLGAFVANASLEGKATFGFVSRYQKGATVPTGNTEFQFHAANLNFKSTSYEWLVIAGAKAQYKGEGTLNGVSGYGFMLSAWDGQVSGGGGVDKLRLKIVDAVGNTVYDNQLGAALDAAPTTALGGGSVVIHAGGKGGK